MGSLLSYCCMRVHEVCVCKSVWQSIERKREIIIKGFVTMSDSTSQVLYFLRDVTRMYKVLLLLACCTLATRVSYFYLHTCCTLATVLHVFSPRMNHYAHTWYGLHMHVNIHMVYKYDMCVLQNACIVKLDLSGTVFSGG